MSTTTTTTSPASPPPRPLSGESSSTFWDGASDISEVKRRNNSNGRLPQVLRATVFNLPTYAEYNLMHYSAASPDPVPSRPRLRLPRLRPSPAHRDGRPPGGHLPAPGAQLEHLPRLPAQDGQLPRPARAEGVEQALVRVRQTEEEPRLLRGQD